MKPTAQSNNRELIWHKAKSNIELMKMIKEEIGGQQRNPAHYCMNGCNKYLGFRGLCSTKCHDEFYDGLAKDSFYAL